MKYFKTLLLTFLTIICTISFARAQSVKLIGGNIVNGALTGLALGGATMGLQNSGDLNVLKFGLGAGLLYGVGVGIYDLSVVPKGQRFYTSATFNNGHNSTIIVLLDTIYGAAAGAIIGSAVSLLSNSYFVDGLQYGASAGTWVGFGFGLIDSFVLAKGPRQFRASAIHQNPRGAQGLIQFAADQKKVQFGLVNPTVFSQKVVKGNRMIRDYSFGVEVLNINIRL